jgi:hypothetical protein
MKECTKECKKHGLVRHSCANNRNYYRCIKCASETTKYRRHQIRKELIQYAGGKCSRCEYSKYSEVLEFHHKDPSKKHFEICGSNITKYNKTILKKEVDKCDLLCANCHRETHVELKEVFNYKPKEYRRSIKCIHCGADTKNKKYCSPKCFAENKILTKPTKEDLQKLLNEYTYSEIAEKLEVARTTIFKWTSEYGLTNNSGQGRIQA